MFIGSLVSIVNTCNFTKSLKNQQSLTQPIFISLHPNDYGQGLRYYQFAVNLDGCTESCNTLNNLSN